MKNLLIFSFALLMACSIPGDEIRLTTNGSVSVNEQLWHHLGKDIPFQPNGYEIYFRGGYVGKLKVDSSWYALRQSEGEYVWNFLKWGDVVSDLLACYNQLLNGNGAGNCAEIKFEADTK